VRLFKIQDLARLSLFGDLVMKIVRMSSKGSMFHKRFML